MESVPEKMEKHINYWGANQKGDIMGISSWDTMGHMTRKGSSTGIILIKAWI